VASHFEPTHTQILGGRRLLACNLTVIGSRATGL
jgi:hypothetical protein